MPDKLGLNSGGIIGLRGKDPHTDQMYNRTLASAYSVVRRQMREPESSMENTFRDSARWLWLSAFTTFAIITLSNGRLLLGSGMLLLGVFAFYNNPLGPASPNYAKPTPVLAASWAFGLFGILAVVAAGVRAWL